VSRVTYYNVTKSSRAALQAYIQRGSCNHRTASPRRPAPRRSTTTNKPPLLAELFRTWPSLIFFFSYFFLFLFFFFRFRFRFRFRFPFFFRFVFFCFFIYLFIFSLTHTSNDLSPNRCQCLGFWPRILQASGGVIASYHVTSTSRRCYVSFVELKCQSVDPTVPYFSFFFFFFSLR